MSLRRCEDESIDELAAYVGAGEAVAALTKRCDPGKHCHIRKQRVLQARLCHVDLHDCLANLPVFDADLLPIAAPWAAQ